MKEPPSSNTMKCEYPVRTRTIALLFITWSVASMTSLVVSAGDIKSQIKHERCYDIDDRRECMFLPVNWLSEWSTAMQFCTVHGSKLITIRSRQMQYAVEEYVRDGQLAWYVRTGAQLKHDPSMWFWKTQSHHFDVNKIRNQSTSADYRTHAAIKQVEVSKTEFDVEVAARHPTDQLPYICQYPASNTYCGDPDGSFRIGGWCYVLHPITRVTWYQARNKCLSEGGDLAAFDDIDDIPRIRSLMESSPYWVLLRNSYWHWSDGHEMLYSNWGFGQPTGIENTCMVLDFRDPWKWKAYDCVERFTYICHKDDERFSLDSNWTYVCIFALLLSVATALLVHFEKKIRRSVGSMYIHCESDEVYASPDSNKCTMFSSSKAI